MISRKATQVSMPAYDFDPGLVDLFVELIENGEIASVGLREEGSPAGS